MYHTTILNPKSNRQNKVRVFEIATKEALTIVKESGVKELSWHLLNQKESISDMESELGGDSSTSNFALSIFENALDFALGITVLNYLKAFANTYPGKQPKQIRVACNRKGDTFILNKENRIVFS